jgi:hypothetical protein
MMGGQRPWFARIRDVVDLPGLGTTLYRLNVSRPIVKSMAREHVCSDPDWLSGARLAAKLAVTRGSGARHASARFVSGGLDRVESRVAFLELARRANVPILLVFGNQTPPKSRAEMVAPAELPKVQIQGLATGKLAIYEEFREAVASAIMP